ncbi:MAG: adenylate/guanylate cyclase domain-containing response regulator, partial [Alphaproteobacteria bacterium]|nr:adenylate/guanylate cyclase domain-containing response regulator [Alphaproteobacteria bacterium]
AVNVAARMESNGEAGRIALSESTYNHVKQQFECEHRGQIEAKNKGLLDMYFLNGVKHEFAQN